MTADLRINLDSQEDRNAHLRIRSWAKDIEEFTLADLRSLDVAKQHDTITLYRAGEPDNVLKDRNA